MIYVFIMHTYYWTDKYCPSCEWKKTSQLSDQDVRSLIQYLIVILYQVCPVYLTKLEKVTVQ